MLSCTNNSALGQGNLNSRCRLSTCLWAAPVEINVSLQLYSNIARVHEILSPCTFAACSLALSAVPNVPLRPNHLYGDIEWLQFVSLVYLSTSPLIRTLAIFLLGFCELAMMVSRQESQRSRHGV